MITLYMSTKTYLSLEHENKDALMIAPETKIELDDTMEYGVVTAKVGSNFPTLGIRL